MEFWNFMGHFFNVYREATQRNWSKSAGWWCREIYSCKPYLLGLMGTNFGKHFSFSFVHFSLHLYKHVQIINFCWSAGLCEQNRFQLQGICKAKISAVLDEKARTLELLNHSPENKCKWTRQHKPKDIVRFLLNLCKMKGKMYLSKL